MLIGLNFKLLFRLITHFIWFPLKFHIFFSPIYISLFSSVQIFSTASKLIVCLEYFKKGTDFENLMVYLRVLDNIYGKFTNISLISVRQFDDFVFIEYRSCNMRCSECQCFPPFLVSLIMQACKPLGSTMLNAECFSHSFFNKNT